MRYMTTFAALTTRQPRLSPVLFALPYFSFFFRITPLAVTASSFQFDLRRADIVSIPCSFSSSSSSCNFQEVGTAQCVACTANCAECAEFAGWCTSCYRSDQLDKDTRSCSGMAISTEQITYLCIFVFVGFLLQYRAYKQVVSSDKYLVYLSTIQMARRNHIEERDAHFEEVQQRQVEMNYLTERLRNPEMSEREEEKTVETKED